MSSPSAILLTLGALLMLCGAPARADEPLAKRIDQLVAAKSPPLAPVAGDAEFVRRIYLDLAGRIPSHQELRKFLESKEPDKRVKLIDELLAGPDYPRRMAELFSAMLMERRGENSEWLKFIRASFDANKPWDRLAREIIDPDPDNETTRGAAFFYTKRLEKVGEQETDYSGLTRDVGRLFLGMDLQCAQCHNHLFIDYYKQQDFQGLFIAFQNTFIRNDVKFPAVGEKLITAKLDFMSVFDKVPLSTGPRMPGGKELEIPKFEKGQEYERPPDRKINFQGVPKFSALEALAHEMSTPQNRAFLENIANRLWFVMMGRGLVDPLDQLHPANPPSHPEVLALLGQELSAHQFDMKWLIRELAMTETYQRSSVLPSSGDAPPPETYQVANEKRLSAEQICWSVLVATGGRQWNGPQAEDLDKLRAAFVKAFGNPPQDPEIEFAPSLKAALFVLNDATVLEMLKPQPGNLLERLSKLSDPAAVSDELYQSVLSRLPSEEEKLAVADYLKANDARREHALSNLAWALLASTEFAINH